jgi:hypothetical protein
VNDPERAELALDDWPLSGPAYSLPKKAGEILWLLRQQVL